MRRLPPKCACGKVAVVRVTRTGKRRVKHIRGTTTRGKKNLLKRKTQRQRKVNGLSALAI